jgi:hypothetical protein
MSSRLFFVALTLIFVGLANLSSSVLPRAMAVQCNKASALCTQSTCQNLQGIQFAHINPCDSTKSITPKCSKCTRQYPKLNDIQGGTAIAMPPGGLETCIDNTVQPPRHVTTTQCGRELAGAGDGCPNNCDFLMAFCNETLADTNCDPTE